MESKHETPAPTSPGPYVENYRGFTLTLEFSDGETTVRAIASGDVTWLTPYGRSWIRQLEEIRGLVDKYLAARAWCEAIRRGPAGAVWLPQRNPVVA